MEADNEKSGVENWVIDLIHLTVNGFHRGVKGKKLLRPRRPKVISDESHVT